MHRDAYRYIAGEVATLKLPIGAVVEIGSRNINGSVRPLFEGRKYIGIDLMEGPMVDVVADGATYEPETPPTVVVCAEVLEHTPDAAAVCANAYNMLADGGVFILTAAGVQRTPHSAVDGGEMRPGEFYQNVSAEDLHQWLAMFDEVRVQTNPEAGDIYATAFKRGSDGDNKAPKKGHKPRRKA